MKNWLGFRQQEIDNYQRVDARSVGSPEGTRPSALTKRDELAACDIRHTIFFCFLFPVVGYSYTGRFNAFGIYLVSSVVAILMLSHIFSEQITQSEKRQLPLAISLSAIAAADNSKAIFSARRAVKRNQ